MKRTLSPAARKAISQAAKRRWAQYRAKKAGGAKMKRGKPGPKPGRKGGRRGRSVAARKTGGYAGHSVNELISMRRSIDLEIADRMVREHVG
jgi:hypothetical protein